jgi:hypothetical protein
MIVTNNSYKIPNFRSKPGEIMLVSQAKDWPNNLITTKWENEASLGKLRQYYDLSWTPFLKIPMAILKFSLCL